MMFMFCVVSIIMNHPASSNVKRQAVKLSPDCQCVMEGIRMHTAMRRFRKTARVSSSTPLVPVRTGTTRASYRYRLLLLQ